MAIDNDSPPGSWKQEMERMPWKFSQHIKVEDALKTIRQSGLWNEATVLALEIKTLRDELEIARGNTG